jgi:hypothetical protein
MGALARPVILHGKNCPQHQQQPLRPRARCLGKVFCIEDAEAFVQSQLNASRRVYAPEEREELVAEGLRILVELADRFEPHRDGYEGQGRLPGFCAKYLRLKLEDAYHRLHPEHRLVTQPDGRRRYLYGEHAVSLDALTGDDPDREPVLASVKSLDAATVARRAHKALWDRWQKRVEQWAEIAGLMADGASDSDIAEILGISLAQVKEAKAAIAPEMPYIIGGEAA